MCFICVICLLICWRRRRRKKSIYPVPSGPKIIKSVKDPSKCIRLLNSDAQARDKSSCVIWNIDPRAQPEQEWFFDQGLIKSVKYPGKCIHLQSGNKASVNGDLCVLKDIRKGSYLAQEWRYDGRRRLIISEKAPSMCIHLENGAASDGNSCFLWDIQSVKYDAQEWILMDPQQRVDPQQNSISVIVDAGTSGNSAPDDLVEQSLVAPPTFTPGSSDAISIRQKTGLESQAFEEIALETLRQENAKFALEKAALARQLETLTTQSQKMHSEQSLLVTRLVTLESTIVEKMQTNFDQLFQKFARQMTLPPRSLFLAEDSPLAAPELPASPIAKSAVSEAESQIIPSAVVSQLVSSPQSIKHDIPPAFIMLPFEPNAVNGAAEKSSPQSNAVKRQASVIEALDHSEIKENKQFVSKAVDLPALKKNSSLSAHEVLPETLLASSKAETGALLKSNKQEAAHESDSSSGKDSDTDASSGKGDSSDSDSGKGYGAAPTLVPAPASEVLTRPAASNSVVSSVSAQDSQIESQVLPPTAALNEATASVSQSKTAGNVDKIVVSVASASMAETKVTDSFVRVARVQSVKQLQETAGKASFYVGFIKPLNFRF